MEEGRWEKMREGRRERHVGSGREEGREILVAGRKGSSKKRDREGARREQGGKERGRTCAEILEAPSGKGKGGKRDFGKGKGGKREFEKKLGTCLLVQIL